MDDYPDAAATVFTYLNSARIITTPNLHKLPPPPLTQKAVSLADN